MYKMYLKLDVDVDLNISQLTSSLLGLSIQYSDVVLSSTSLASDLPTYIYTHITSILLKVTSPNTHTHSKTPINFAHITNITTHTNTHTNT